MNEPFRSYKLEEEKDPNDITFTVRITPEDRVWFLPAKIILQQAKLSTAIKQLAEVGAANVLNSENVNKILSILQNNIRRNRRLGIPDSEIKKLK